MWWQCSWRPTPVSLSAGPPKAACPAGCHRAALPCQYQELLRSLPACKCPSFMGHAGRLQNHTAALRLFLMTPLQLCSLTPQPPAGKAPRSPSDPWDQQSRQAGAAGTGWSPARSRTRTHRQFCDKPAGPGLSRQHSAQTAATGSRQPPRLPAPPRTAAPARGSPGCRHRGADGQSPRASQPVRHLRHRSSAVPVSHAAGSAARGRLKFLTRHFPVPIPLRSAAGAAAFGSVSPGTGMLWDEGGGAAKSSGTLTRTVPAASTRGQIKPRRRPSETRCCGAGRPSCRQQLPEPGTAPAQRYGTGLGSRSRWTCAAFLGMLRAERWRRGWDGGRSAARAEALQRREGFVRHSVPQNIKAVK